ncbi:MAG: alanine racemase [Aquificota bacterium]|jgi:alanine racemase|nr:alanine racemase [Aquificaceae bacterium]QWK12632.1 MAG: alanine racemase [Aquificota bacterium]HAV39753.1 alanine racemase [Aquificaceae bacterium]HCO38857.1 alanine racemase [Aquificaceae bacterium]
MYRAVLSIRSQNIKENLVNLLRYTGKPIIAVVKANAYGIGAIYVSSILENFDEVSAFAVACVEEGIELRRAGIKKKILVLGGVLKGEAKAFLEYNLTPVVSHWEHLKALEGLNVPIQVKYDTGMGRLGFLEELVEDERVEGVLSHLSSPLDRDFSSLQIEKFEKIVKRYSNLRYIHMESSAGVVYRIPFTTHIRVGLALYGEKPMQDYPIELKRAIELKARIISIKDLPAGFPISYSRTYITEKPTRVGVVAFGYADGLMKSLSNKAYLYYQGKPIKILGNITMDMTMVDLTGTEAKVGDWVEIVGENQSFTDLAKLAGTIPYELMTNLSSRIRRQVCS